MQLNKSLENEKKMKTPNIFDGLAKASDNDIVIQLSLLEAVNMSNVLKSYGTKIEKGAKNILNKIGKKISKNWRDIEIPESKELLDYINEKQKELQKLSRADLDKKMFDVLKEKVNLTGEQDVTYDLVSCAVIEKAALNFDISRNLTPAQKADAIYQRFTEKMLVNLQETLKKQDSRAAQKTIDVLQKSIEEMPLEQQQQLKEALKIDKLTGETLRNALLNVGGVTAVVTTLAMSGFGAFVALTTVIHAVFTSLLGITLPFAVYTSATSLLAFLTGPAGVLLIFGNLFYQFYRGNRKLDEELLAQIVWFSVSSYGDYFTPKDETLPSWVPKEKEKEIALKEEGYRRLVEEREKLLKESKESKQKINDLSERISKLEKYLEKEVVNRKKAEERANELTLTKKQLISKLAEYDKEVQELEQKLKEVSTAEENSEIRNALLQAQQERDLLRKQLDGVNERLQESEWLLTLASEEINKQSYVIEELKNEKTRLEAENESLRKLLKEKDAILEAKEEKRRKEIMKKWTMLFSDFQIEPGAVRNVARYTQNELISVEKALMELHYAKDPRALSRGKLRESGNDHLGFTLPGGLPGRIEYKVLGNQRPRIKIIRIYKHNEKIYN